jgi:hypothetical protein
MKLNKTEIKDQKSKQFINEKYKYRDFRQIIYDGDSINLHNIPNIKNRFVSTTNVLSNIIQNVTRTNI